MTSTNRRSPASLASARSEGYVEPGTDGEKRCRYTPHSLRATTATLLDEAGVGIKKIQDLLGHRDIRVTQT